MKQVLILLILSIGLSRCEVVQDLKNNNPENNIRSLENQNPQSPIPPLPTQGELNKQWTDNLKSTTNYYWNWNVYSKLENNEIIHGSFTLKRDVKTTCSWLDRTETTYRFIRAISASKAEYEVYTAAYKGKTITAFFKEQKIILEINPWNYYTRFTEAVQGSYPSVPNFGTDILYRRP
ncbi:hypothetical protein SAMN02745150_00356 [Brevinema andersonii]|uniref:Uncharacterized protein n=1 Tax=Brevinema andersonii TaxID=34097 RepID=A0A1I1DD59_BREAD|nr:hypothetical protein [Brevinema andersonii]SFB70473.1 hypothetical protein SAMN02745150_00356 [Brevinema andersonii]